MSTYDDYLEEQELARQARQKLEEEEEQKKVKAEEAKAAAKTQGQAPKEEDSGDYDMLLAVPRGLAAAGAGIVNLFGADIHDNFGLGKSQGAVSGFLEGTTQFIAGFLPGMWGVGHLTKATGIMKGAGVASQIGRTAAAGAVADFAVFDAHDARLSNLIEDLPMLENPVTSYLAMDEDDTQLEGRMKSVIEGALMGGIADSIFLMLKGMRNFNKASRAGDAEGMDSAKLEIEDAAEDAHHGSENPELDEMTQAGADGGPRTEAADAADADMDLTNPTQNRTPQDPTPQESPRDLADPKQVDPNGGDVYVIDTSDEGAFIRIHSALQDVTQVPESALGLVQLKPAKDIRIAKSHTARKLGIKRPQGLPEAEWLDYQKKFLKDQGYQVLQIKRGNKTITHVLDPKAVLKRIEVVPTSKYMERRLAAVRTGARDPNSPAITNDPLEMTRDRLGEVTQQKVKEVAQKLRDREEAMKAAAETDGPPRAPLSSRAQRRLGEDEIDPAEEAIAGLLNVRVGTSADHAYTAAALIEELTLRPLAAAQKAGIQSNEDLITSISRTELPRMLGQDPATVANSLKNRHGTNVTAAYKEALAAKLVMNQMAKNIKALSADLLGKAGEDSTLISLSRMAAADALSVDEAASLLLKQIDGYTALAVSYGRVSGEFGRGLQSFDISVDRMLDNDITAGVMERGGRAMLVKMARRIKDLDNLQIAEQASRNQLKGLMGKITPYYMFSLLSKPATLTTNIGSTGMFGIFTPLERAAGSFLQSVFRKNPDAKAGFRSYTLQMTQVSRMRAVLFADIALYRDTDMANGIRQAASRSGKSGRSQLTGKASAMRENDIAETVSSGDLSVPPGSAAGEAGEAVPLTADEALRSAFGRAIGMPGKIMAASDEAMKQIFYQSEIFMHLRNVGEQKLGLSGEQLDMWVHEKTRKFLINDQAVSERGIRLEVERDIPEGSYVQEDQRQHAINTRVQERLTDTDRSVPSNAEGPATIGDTASIPFEPGENLASIGQRAKLLAETDSFTRNMKQSDGFLASAGSHLMDLANSYPSVKLVAPFIRTPMNILIETNKRLPLPFFNKQVIPALALMSNKLVKTASGKEIPTLTNMGADLRAKLMSSDKQLASETAGNLMVAGTVAVTALTLSASGIITGKGPQDPEATKALRAVGWQPYSIKVGDTYVGFQRLDPLGGLLGFVGDMGDLGRYSGKDQDMGDLSYAMVLTVMRNINNKSYISGLVDLAGAVKDPDRYLGKLAQRLAGSVVPNVIAGTGAAIDPTLKEAYGVMDGIQRRVPFLNESLDKQRNFLGEPISRKMMSRGMAQVTGWAEYILPISINTASSGVIEKELQALMYPMNEPDHTRFGVDLREYRNEEGRSAYDRWQEITSEVSIGGRKIRSAVERLIKSRKYQSLPIESYRDSGFTSPRVTAMRRIVNQYRRKAQKQVLKEYEQLKTDTDTRRFILKRQRQGAGADEILNLLGR